MAFESASRFSAMRRTRVVNLLSLLAALRTGLLDAEHQISEPKVVPSDLSTPRTIQLLLPRLKVSPGCRRARPASGPSVPATPSPTTQGISLALDSACTPFSANH